MTVDEQLAYLTSGCVDVVRAGELKAKLERAFTIGRPLVVKVGFDPTAPDLHLGHTVLIRKMKHFQDLGHTVVYVVGSFTALIGDPTGRSKTRPPLTLEEIAANAETYKTQIFKILDPAKTQVRFNSDWLEPLGSFGWIKLAAKYNVAQMLERREFKKRYESGQPIAVHEFLYPLGQAYDSVVLQADVELGGTDQLFNLNVGRDIMPAFDLEPQVVMTTPLLEGLDGVEKMSKSTGNYVGITESPAEMFGKLMSISDELMWKYYALLTDLTAAEVAARQAAVSTGQLHPKQAKADLARTIVSDFHGAAAAQSAADEFEKRFSRREVLEDVAERPMVAGTLIEHLLLETGLAQSGSDATRKVRQGAVRIDGEKFTQPRTPVDRREPFVLQVGRHVYRIVVVSPVDVMVTTMPGRNGGDMWILMQNKGQVDVAHASRESAMSRAREVAAASRGRVIVLDDGRVREADV
ncbi:MAG: tyrosine--tRNA ligase [Acidobacteria bacterium]|nr:tyrosine--tRNA ligase [Acidobacteriota bacterium]MCA1651889.1 tyrosine--tRNA ligase [Acidobacteriota bacterium]